MNEAEPLTIAEAAAALGVSERTLYRIIKTGNNAASTLSEQRQTATGRRLTTLIPPELMDELRRQFSATHKAEQEAAAAPKDVDGNDDNDAAKNDDSGDVGGTLPAVVYQQRIADLEAVNVELRADKDRLYRLLEASQANLAREQALRALPAPTSETPEPPNSLQGRPQEGATGFQASEATPPAEGPTAAKSWWARMWRRMKM